MDEEWNKLIILYLGSKLRRRMKEIKLNIQFVDFGLKPSYLLDFGVNSLDSLINLIHDLESRRLIQRHLLAVKLEMDYVVTNPDVFMEMYTEPYDVVKFVDITSDNTPKVLVKSDALDQVISTCFSAVTDGSLKPADDINMTSVFGVLIGYPVVYWFEPDSLKSAGNSQVVQHAEVLGMTDNEQTEVVYSFSYPDNLINVLEKHVSAWFQKWEEAGKWKELFKSVSMKCERRTLLSMVL